MVFRAAYGYKVFLVAVCDATGNIVGGMPVAEVDGPVAGKRWVSFPFSDHCVILCDEERYKIILKDYLTRGLASNEFGSMEIRGDCPGAQARSAPYLLHQLKLRDDPGKIFIDFKKTQTQQCIRKAERSRIDVRIIQTQKAMEAFYRLMIMTRRSLGVPVQPKRFFMSLWSLVISRGHGSIFLAHLDGRPVAGAIFLTFKNTIVYKYSASDPTYRKLRPNNLVLWKAIEWGCANGYDRLDLGRTDRSHAGLRNFKLGYGASESEICYSYIYGSHGRVSPVRRYGNARWSKYLIRKSPAFVCRVIGELFYRNMG